MSNPPKGRLYVVATPIGNREDFSPRAQRVLSEADLIAAEDTRHSGRLLAAFGIQAQLRSLHEHNEDRVVAELVQRLAGGETVALISDAGTPLISDPGFALVRACHEAGVRVIPVPGPSAAIAALSVSGIATDRFRFEGFLPRTKARRRETLTQLRSEQATLIFYEAPHRLLETLEDIAAVLGADRQSVLARELTKVHETVIRAPLGELHRRVAEDPEQRLGEMVLVVAGNTEAPASYAEEALDDLLRVLLDYLPVKQAAAAAARVTGAKKNALYERALELKGAS